MVKQFLILYQRRGGDVMSVITSNVDLTVAMLEAQGFVIIDIIDL
ncbi:MAG: hypothetical protein Q7U74_12360 [Saprospiraceae bacterium]|nr:hypothetical protein [Saprospiraceae bacterium]